MPTFKILAGKHTQKEPVHDAHGDVVKNEQGEPVLETKTYKRGDVFFSRHDLVKTFNRPGCTKFELMDASPSGRARTVKTSESVEEARDQAKVPSTTAPGGQAAQGFQKSATAGVENEVGGVSQPAQPTLGQIAAQKAKESTESTKGGGKR